MEIFRLDRLLKLKKKNIGNTKLLTAVDKLILDLKKAEWKTKTDILQERPDADCVHSSGFYFFDINIHRTMILVVLEEGKAVIVWAGSHDEYDKTFKGNRNTIEKWLRNQQIL